MAFTFKLGNPTDEVKSDICRVPAWLEESISMVHSEYDESVLGNVDTSLIRTEPFNYAENSRAFGDYYDYRNQPLGTNAPAVNQASTAADGSGFWEVKENEFGFHKNGNGAAKDPQKLTKPMHPKLFCDNLYMSLVNILYAVSDEQNAATIQSRFNGLLEDLEKQYLNQ